MQLDVYFLPARIKASLFERTAESAAQAAARHHAVAAATRQQKLNEALAKAEKYQRENFEKLKEDPDTIAAQNQRDEEDIAAAAAAAAAAVRPPPKLVAEARFCVTGGGYDIHPTIRTVSYKVLAVWSGGSSYTILTNIAKRFFKPYGLFLSCLTKLELLFGCITFYLPSDNCMLQVKVDSLQDEWLSLVSPSQMQTTTPKGTIHLEVPKLQEQEEKNYSLHYYF